MTWIRISGMLACTAIGATFGYAMFDSAAAALGLGCSVTGCVLGALFGFQPNEDG